MDSKVSPQAPSQDVLDTAQSTADLTAFVQNLLQQMQSRFQTMSDSIISKNILSRRSVVVLASFVTLTVLLDEMGTRIEDLEKSIGDLVKEVGVEPVSPSTQGQSDSSQSDITNT